MRSGSRENLRLVVESAALGVGYATTLIWIGSALVAIFTNREPDPYWSVIPHLRTDTAGVLAFAVAAVSLSVARYLQLGRPGDVPGRRAIRPAGVRAVQSAAETAVILCTGLVIYLSFNAVTHPETLQLQLTHLWPWPSEGTVRVIGLAVCLVSVAIRRYLRATAARPGPAARGAQDDLAGAGLPSTDQAPGYASRRAGR